jgi:hypothetical protein
VERTTAIGWHEVGRARFRQRGVRPELHNRVELWIDCLDTIEERARDLLARKFAVAQHGCEPADRKGA